MLIPAAPPVATGARPVSIPRGIGGHGQFRVEDFETGWQRVTRATWTRRAGAAIVSLTLTRAPARMCQTPSSSRLTSAGSVHGLVDALDGEAVVGRPQAKVDGGVAQAYSVVEAALALFLDQQRQVVFGVTRDFVYELHGQVKAYVVRRTTLEGRG